MVEKIVKILNFLKDNISEREVYVSNISQTYWHVVIFTINNVNYKIEIQNTEVTLIVNNSHVSFNIDRSDYHKLVYLIEMIEKASQEYVYKEFNEIINLIDDRDLMD